MKILLKFFLVLSMLLIYGSYAKGFVAFSNGNWNALILILVCCSIGWIGMLCAGRQLDAMR